MELNSDIHETEKIPHRPKVSGVITSFNEEHNIAECIESLLWCDEIILVDDASTDDTVRVARGLGLTVFTHQKNRGYGANQKMCYRKALERGADIVVMAVGRRHMLLPDMVKPGAIVIDVGTHPVERDGKWTLDGDVHPDVEGVAGFMTPVPGGVGIVTTAILMRHVTAAACPGALEPAW